MKKFVFLYYGWEQPTPAIAEAWMSWFASLDDRIINSGNPFGGGREVTRDGVRDLSADTSPIAGYSIISATDFDEAEQLLDGLPFIDSVRIYEAVPM